METKIEPVYNFKHNYCLAIKSGDNDYYNTFVPILETIKNGLIWNGFSNQSMQLLYLNKKHLAFVINEIIGGHYLLFQNEKGLENLEAYERTKKYCRITPDDILLNEEVEEYLKNTEWDNGETHILEIISGNQIRIYNV